MDYLDFASDLPLDRAFAFSSAEENEETLQRLGVLQTVRQLGAGTFRCDMAVRSTKHADLFSDRFNKAVSIYLEPPAGTLAFLFPRSASGRFVASGDKTSNDKLIVLPDGSGTDIVIPDLAGSDSILVAQSQFNEMTDVLCPMPKCVRPEGMAVIAGNTAQLHALRKAVVNLVAESDLAPPDEQVSNLVAATIAWAGHSSNDRRAEGFNGNGVHVGIAKRAQEFIHEHYCDAVHIVDLCRVTRVGVRTLQRCFREYFDLTISEYLKAVRLDAAHRELFAAHPLQVSVATVALKHGLTHLGRFSVEFRQRFGQSPSETLAM